MHASAHLKPAIQKPIRFARARAHQRRVYAALRGWRRETTETMERVAHQLILGLASCPSPTGTNRTPAVTTTS